MIELVFVLVILGILASLAMGRMDRDLRQEAAETILSHIRLTQQLALRDNKHSSDNNNSWQRAYWNINLSTCENGDWSYIEDVKNLQKSFQALNVKKVFSGVFGHSHRQVFVGNKDGKIHEVNGYRQTDNIDQLIINTGSIGQPRGRGLGYIILEIEDDRLTKASFKQININFNNSISLIKKAGFSCETEAKLIKYLQE